jgi:hypothetical protein
MASGLVVHVEVGAERHTEVLMHERIRIGSDADCELRFQPRQHPARRRLSCSNSNARTAIIASATSTARSADAQRRALAPAAAIEDGDMVRIPDTDFVLQFFPVESPPALVSKRRTDIHVAPFIENAAIESAATARRDDAKVFLREFTRELVREINLSTKIVALLIVVALVGGILYFGLRGLQGTQAEPPPHRGQNAQIARLNQKVGESQSQFQEVNRSNKDIINSLSLAPKLRSEYGDGVCLISGMYVFVETGTGRPLRYPQRQSATRKATARKIPEAAESEMLTPEGRARWPSFLTSARASTSAAATS